MSAKTAIAKYALLPQIIPRFAGLFTSGFGWIAYLLAVLFHAVNLLPPAHPYINPQNMGKYKIRNVITLAYKNLNFTWKNIDQILIFFAILTGMLLILGQAILFGIAVYTQEQAISGPTNPLYEGSVMHNIFSVDSKFGHPGNEEQDLVFMMLDKTFGVQNIFKSCISTGTPCLNMEGKPSTITSATYPEPFHKGLHALFAFFSYAIFFVGALVLTYFAVTIVGETAVTGAPFGQRFNKAWYPIRIIVFFALLVPLNMPDGQNSGLNAAQHITMWTAKFGSNMATNGWGYFKERSGGAFIGDTDKLIARPETPEIINLVKFMSVAKTCRFAEEASYTNDHKKFGGIQAYIVRDAKTAQTVADGQPDARELEITNYNSAQKFSNYGAITIRFGLKGKKEGEEIIPSDHALQKGYVKPLCGELIFQTASVGNPDSDTTRYDAQEIQEAYYETIRNMWRDPLISRAAVCFTQENIHAEQDLNCLQPNYNTKSFARLILAEYEALLEKRIDKAISDIKSRQDWNISTHLANKGWGGAAVWYNRIAYINGAVASAVMAIPQPFKYPQVMEEVAAQKNAQDNANTEADRFSPILAKNQKLKFSRKDEHDENIAKTLHDAFLLWSVDGLENEGKESETNMVRKALNLLFGTSGIFELRNNLQIHPLAQLSMAGRSLLEASIRNFGVGLIGRGATQILSSLPKELAETGSSFLTGIAFSTISISIVLYYILPFLPFLYFLFAIATWVKAIFEAMVAMPLWALAHVTSIDGNGLPGQTALNGYFLLFEILIRPFLIVVGLIAALNIFSAQVFLLNDSFNLVTANMMGVDSDPDSIQGVINYIRGPIDQLFFTTVYAVACYIMAMTSFKLIDLIPNKILRFMGGSVQTLSEFDTNPGDSLTQQGFKATSILSGSVQGGKLAALVGA